MGDTDLQTVHLSYGNRSDRPRRGVTLNCDVGAVWHCAFHASAYGPGGAIHSPPMSDWDFPFGAAQILRVVRDMVETRNSPPITAEMLEAVAICAAARQAQEAEALRATLRDTIERNVTLERSHLQSLQRQEQRSSTGHV